MTETIIRHTQKGGGSHLLTSQRHDGVDAAAGVRKRDAIDSASESSAYDLSPPQKDYSIAQDA